MHSVRISRSWFDVFNVICPTVVDKVPGSDTGVKVDISFENDIIPSKICPQEKILESMSFSS